MNFLLRHETVFMGCVVVYAVLLLLSGVVVLYFGILEAVAGR